MANFDDRQKAFETKFVLDAELEFKINARRNKLLGLWAAEKLGKNGSEAEQYAKDVVMADMEKSGDEDIIDKLFKDFGRAGLTIHISEIEQQIADLAPVARKQLMEGK